MKKEQIKFLHYTDVHIRETNPPSRLGDYRQDILDKMSQIMDIAIERKVDFTTCGGDLFDPVKAMAIKHATVVETAKIYQKVNIPHFIVPGNHDLQGDRMESLQERPLGVLLETCILRQMTDQVFSKGNIKIQMFSNPFEEEPDLSLFTNTAQEDIDASILGIHIYSSPRGGSLWGNTKIFSYKELSTTAHDIYLLGHYHADNGAITEEFIKGKPQTFVNVGSVSRGDYGDENLKRNPKVCLVTITKGPGGVTIETEEIPLRVKSIQETFDLERKETLAKQKVDTEQFVTQLQESSKLLDKAEDITEQVEILSDEKEVRDSVLFFITKAHEELSLKKGKTKNEV